MTAKTVRLPLIGLNRVKLALHQRLAHGETILFSENLSKDEFEQTRAEQPVTKFSRSRPMRAWEVISGCRNEALDTLAYSCAGGSLSS